MLSVLFDLFALPTLLHRQYFFLLFTNNSLSITAHQRTNFNLLSVKVLRAYTENAGC